MECSFIPLKNAWIHFLFVVSALVSACGQSTNQGQSDGGFKVNVHYGAESRSIEIGATVQSAVEGNSGAKISDLIAKAFPQATFSSIGADLVGTDGFRPSGRSTCRLLIPMKGDVLTKGVLDPQSGNVLWAPSLGFGGCMNVKTVVEILLVNLSDAGLFIQVKLGENTTDVDLRFQPTADISGEQRINLQNLLKASGVTDSPQNYNFDIKAANGTSPVGSHGLTPITWEQLASFSLSPVTRDIHFDPLLGLSDEWNITNAASIELHNL